MATIKHMIVAVILARGGSKGIPRKNIKPFAGKPLLAWSVEHALACRRITAVAVSSDDPEMLDVATKAGATHAILRPHHLATDDATDLEGMRHAVKELVETGVTPSVVVHLRPTFPLRPPTLIDTCLDRLQNTPGASSVRTVVPCPKSPFKMYVMESTVLTPICSPLPGIPEPWNVGRQVLPQAFLHNGAVDVLNVATTLDVGSMTGPRIAAVVMDADATDDIDTPGDWAAASAKATATPKRHACPSLRK